MASCALGKLGVEVPLGRVDWARVPAVEVDALGEPLFEFPPVRPAAGRVFLPPGSPNVRNTIWQLDPAAPAELRLVEYGFAAEWEETAARVRFGTPLLPAVATACVPGATQLALVTADGALHLVAAPALLQDQRAKGQPPSMPALLGEEGGVRSAALGALFARAGAPTATLLVAGHACVGTDQGSVLCVPVEALDEGAAVELKAGGSGLSKVFGGFFGRAGGQGVAQLVSLEFDNREFLVAIHEEGYMRLWDVEHRRLVYNCDLLTPSVSASLVPTHAAVTEEPLDSSIFNLLLYCAPRGGAGAGELRAYELFMEQRGEATYKVHVESGPQLPGSIHRLHSLVLENVALHTVGAWMLFEGEDGRRRAACVPLAFGETTVTASSVVLLLEDQLAEAGCEEEACTLVATLWRSVEAALRAAGAELPADAAAGAFMDALLGPGRLSRHALHAALTALGAGRAPALEEVAQCGLEDLRTLLPGWVAAAASGGSVVAAWCALVRHYAAAWRDQHSAIALVRGGDVNNGGMLIVRKGGWVSVVRRAVAPELALQADLPASFITATGAAECESAASALQAAAQVMSALGGQAMGRLAWACMQQGVDLCGVVLPAFCQALAGGRVAAPAQQGAAGGGGSGRAQWAEWRARCRMLPLELGRLWSGAGREGFANAFGQALAMLERRYLEPARRSPLQPVTRPLAAPLVATAAQVCAARVQCLFQLCLLGGYVAATQALGTWTLPPQEAQQLTASLLPKAQRMLAAAAVGYWATVTPLALPADPSSLDPSQLVISLRIGDNGPGSSAPKRARLSAAPDSYVVDSLLKCSGLVGEHVHVVRDLPDLHSVSLRLAELLTGVVPAAASGGGRPGSGLTPSEDSMQLALQVGLELFRGGHSARLGALLRLLPDSADARLLFLKACSVARSIPGIPAAERQQRVEESAALFFRAAAVFGDPAAYEGAVRVLAGCVQQLQEEMAGAYQDEGVQVLELQYHETVMMLFERLGCPEAASRFALAATKQVPAALPLPDQSVARQQRLGRLWANVFAHAIEDGEYEEAYAAMLSNPVPEVQLDCMQRLVHSLCNADRVQLLCALPFSATLLVVREGRPTWVTLLEEVAGCLQRRADSLSLDATPQPYKVLYAFHASRGNWQAAAAAMLALSRRLVGEGAGDAATLARAELALGAAVSALSLVEPSQAWLQDPAGRLADVARPLFPHRAASKAGADGYGAAPAPAILTLEQLQREYAVARAHAAVSAAMPGGEATSSQPDDVFSQLLALGLHEAAVSLAEEIYTGCRLTRALEQALSSQAAHCTRLQLQAAAPSRAAGGAAAVGMHPGLGFGDAGDGMEEEDSAGPGEGGSGGPEDGMDGGAAAAAGGWQQQQPAAAGEGGAGGSAAAAAAWRRLRRQLGRFEGGEHGSRLRLLVVESALATERRLGLPPWLLAPFKAGSGDVPGLLRVLMRYDRLEEAAALAIRHLGLATRSVPSVSMQRPAQLCYPHALLQELANRLQAEGLGACHDQLAKAVKEERDGAMRQSAVIQQLFV